MSLQSGGGGIDMGGIIHGFKTFYRTDDNPSIRPNRFVTVALLDRMDGSFEVVEREGDTVPDPFHGTDEIAGVFLTDEKQAKSEFEKRCRQLSAEGWRLYRAE